MISSKRISGFAPIGWQMVSPTPIASQTYSRAIDGNASTVLEVQKAKMPFSITVDMKRGRDLGGFSYLPRQDKVSDGIVESYSFETSVDGKIWKTAIAQGRFDNIRNNPMLQEVHFTPVSARYFRFTALKEINGRDEVSVADLGVLPAR